MIIYRIFLNRSCSFYIFPKKKSIAQQRSLEIITVPTIDDDVEFDVGNAMSVCKTVEESEKQIWRINMSFFISFAPSTYSSKSKYDFKSRVALI